MAKLKRLKRAKRFVVGYEGTRPTVWGQEDCFESMTKREATEMLKKVCLPRTKAVVFELVPVDQE